MKKCTKQKEKDKEIKSLYGIGRRTITTFGLKLALEVYDKANRKCKQCKSEYDLTIHHIDGNGRHNQEKGLPVNNDIMNLVVLCRKCHGSIHGKQSLGGYGKGRRKLEIKQVLAIRDEYSKNIVSQKELSEKYKIDNSQISRIVNRKVWKHISKTEVMTSAQAQHNSMR